MRIVREWAEEYWAEVGVTLLIASALAVSVVLAIAFNVIVTRPAAAEGASLSTIRPAEPHGPLLVVVR